MFHMEHTKKNMARKLHNRKKQNKMKTYIGITDKGLIAIEAKNKREAKKELKKGDYKLLGITESASHKSTIKN